MKHFYNNGKKYLSKDDVKYRQGRSKKQYKTSAMGAFYSGCAFIIILIFIFIVSLLNL